MTERKDIGLRLENWARWCKARGAKGAACMTGAICESLRKAALGNVWSGTQVWESTDEPDAMAIHRALVRITYDQRNLLNWCYIEQARPEVVCRVCKIPIKPISEFISRFRAAQEAIEDAVDNEGNR